MSAFDRFAGQEITSGIRPNEPLMAFEEEATATKLANIAAVQGLLPKISKIIVHETRKYLWSNQLDKVMEEGDGLRPE